MSWSSGQSRAWRHPVAVRIILGAFRMRAGHRLVQLAAASAEGFPIQSSRNGGDLRGQCRRAPLPSGCASVDTAAMNTCADSTSTRGKERKSVEKGKSVSVHVDLGGSRNL